MYDDDQKLEILYLFHYNFEQEKKGRTVDMKSMHFKLFWRYAVLVFSILVAFGILLYYMGGKEFRTNAASELQADCDNISTVLDTQMEKMDQLSKRILNSEELQKLFLEDNYSKEEAAYFHKRAFSETLFEIIRLSFDHMELNMFDISGRYIFVGDTSRFFMKDPDEIRAISWTEKVLSAYGKKVILPTRIPELNETEIPVISLCRAFAPENPTEETAVLELQLDYSYLSRTLEKAIHNQKDKKKIFIYQADGQCIYPYQEVSEETDIFIRSYLEKKTENGSGLERVEGLGSSSIVFVSNTSPYTGWTVLVAENDRDLFAAFYQFRLWIAVISVIVLVLMMMLTNRIAVSLSTPIQKLEKAICTLDLDNLEEMKLPEYRNNFRELDSLYRSFDQMKRNLENSLQNAVSARAMAADAQILALQSQMNPHFLYNTLASISVLAEDGEDEKVVRICEDLSLLLRYISSGFSRKVPLVQELEHTRSYINLIKIKYEERIQFHLDVEQDMLEIQVPKLSVQPLVENCVKYGLEVQPPWIIIIRGYVENGFWNIVIKDNGTGFTEEYLKGFEQEARRISGGQEEFPKLEVNGMGLLNLYTRLWLLYGEDMIFEIGNSKFGGAEIRIGGTIVTV